MVTTISRDDYLTNKSEKFFPPLLGFELRNSKSYVKFMYAVLKIVQVNYETEELLFMDLSYVYMLL